MNDAYKKSGQYYDILYNSYKNDKHTAYEVKIILDQTKTNSTILDLGAGTGRFTLPLLKKKRKVISLDPSKTMLDELKKKLLSENIKPYKILNTEIEKLELKRKVDGIIMFGNVICEFSNTYLTGTRRFKILKKFLKKSGKIIISQSNPYAFDPKKMDFKSVEKKDGYTYYTRYKTSSFNKKENQTSGAEKIVITKGDKKIKTIISPKCIQKWWYPEELKGLLAKESFSDFLLLNQTGKRFNKRAEDFILIASYK